MSLDNKAFRSLLRQEQVALPSQKDAFQSKTVQLTDSERKEKQKEKRVKRIKNIKAFQEKKKLRQQQQAEREANRNKYRDRAKELRDGKNVDYAETNIEFESMDYDTSKYLGGDVKHTHMVKGLDFILLNRVRESLDKQKDEDMEAEFEEVILRGKEKEAEEARKKKSSVPWKSKPARDILEKVVPEKVLGKHAIKKQCELFYPGRMVFFFNRKSDEFQPLPKIVLRAKQECPDPSELNPVVIKSSILKRIKGALKKKSSRRNKNKRRRLKERDRQAATKRRKMDALRKSAPQGQQQSRRQQQSQRKPQSTPMEVEKPVERFNTKPSTSSSKMKAEKSVAKTTFVDPKMKDVDIFEGMGDYSLKESNPDPVFQKPSDDYGDVFGLGNVSMQVKKRHPKKQKEEWEMNPKELQRKMDREADREWKQIQAINNRKYGN